MIVFGAQSADPLLKIKKLNPEAIIPKYQTPGSVAFDLHSTEDVNIMLGASKMIHTGLAVELPMNCELQIRQRSGMSLEYPSYIAIGVGTVDTDYRGELMVPVVNNNRLGKYLKIKKGDRIAQAIVNPILKCEIMEVSELSDTERGAGGFGHTGKE